MIATAMIFGTCFFGWFANSEVEPWNSQQPKAVDDDKNMNFSKHKDSLPFRSKI